jgi:hypothetical protein
MEFVANFHNIRETWGVCTLNNSFSANVPFSKSSYGSVKMTVYFDIINLMEIYMVVNGKKKSI